MVGMPQLSIWPIPECPSRNGSISKSQCPNREVAMLHFWTECPTFLVVRFLIYIYIIFYIILKIITEVVLVSCGNIYIYNIFYNTNIFFVTLLNAFQLDLFRAAIYMQYIYNIFYNTNFFVTLLNAFKLYLFRAEIYIYICIECVQVVLVSCSNIYIYITYFIILTHTFTYAML